MNDPIEREDAIKALYKYNFVTKEVIEREIMSIPSADAVEVVHGEWIDMGDFEQCSVCKGTRLKEFQTYYGKATWIKTDFCPNCGAKMDGERKESE